MDDLGELAIARLSAIAFYFCDNLRNAALWAVALPPRGRRYRIHYIFLR
ncbi:hypothetical protein [Kamptonema sp. UHCC 0994]|nr:hypothetical protein [Kamptonema sp. UHCC 0994]MDF0551588.1 hypothetical protein [Kamptonema sp. UHCC 0994]